MHLMQAYSVQLLQEQQLARQATKTSHKAYQSLTGMLYFTGQTFIYQLFRRKGASDTQFACCCDSSRPDVGGGDIANLISEVEGVGLGWQLGSQS